jgi:hypothetical protein
MVHCFEGELVIVNLRAFMKNAMFGAIYGMRKSPWPFPVLLATQKQVHRFEGEFHRLDALERVYHQLGELEELREVEEHARRRHG